MKKFIADINHLEEVVNEILSNFPFSKIILLKGDLGSGKTTLAKKLIKQLGIHDNVTSPTFNIISEYLSDDGLKIFHFDLYRIKSIDELHEIGFDEYLDSGNVCIIEWPEIAAPLLNSNHNIIGIEMKGDIREYTIENCVIQ